ncbi:pentapeptide repeat-containing protein [Micromonospora ureilytica]|uniref:pentapeptide repeat-containing protein n=1 Tax=Micromonospora ureilytica TaxID=709868 RepID=UPI002E12FF88|nr:pentapeptide repeat-containing protein [Micromonospora ureilytica]
MATIRARLAAVRAAWRTGAPTAAPGRPTRDRRPRPAIVAPRPLRPRRPSTTRLELAPSASLELRPDPWQRLLGLGSILSVIVLAAGLYVTNAANRAQQEANREQQRLTAQGQITDRFTASIEQLGQPGADKVDVRLGAIYALRRIMRDSAADRPAVVEILSAFVRVHSVGGAAAPTPARTDEATGTASVKDNPVPPPVDIHAALAALGDRDSLSDRPDLTRVDLSRTDLRRIDLTGMDLGLANLEGSNLSDAVLTDADLAGANLTGVELFDTELRGANLSGVDLQDVQMDRARLDHATFTGSSLVEASLRFAVLTDAGLSAADLTDADLTGADLTGADLFGVDLLGVVLTEANVERARLLSDWNIQCAVVGDQTRLPPGVNRPAADAHRNDPECRARRAEWAAVR